LQATLKAVLLFLLFDFAFLRFNFDLLPEGLKALILCGDNFIMPGILFYR